MTKRGVVVKYMEDRGFGFIRCYETNPPHDLFFHVKDVVGRRELSVGAKVTFSEATGERGVFACYIVPDDLAAAAPSRRPDKLEPRRERPAVASIDMGQAAAGAVVVCIPGLLLFLPVPFFWKYLAAMQVITYAFYGDDKRRAINGDWRIPEKRLHWLTFLGGTPAAILAQELFRHKTKKDAFRRTQKVVLFVQVLAIAGICTWLYLLPEETRAQILGQR